MKNCKFRVYAEDTDLLFLPILRISVISIVLVFSKAHGPRLRAGKTQILLIGSRMSCTSASNVFVKSAGDVGIIIDSNLRFKKHINKQVRGVFKSFKSKYSS